MPRRNFSIAEVGSSVTEHTRATRATRKASVALKQIDGAMFSLHIKYGIKGYGHMINVIQLAHAE